MSTPVKARAAIYARISQDRGGAGLGVERQEALCRDLAERNGWTVVETLVDNDLSAYHGAPRPAYTRLLEGMETGAYDAVLVVDQDRLTRHTRELEDFIILADKAGTALATASGDLDLSTSDGRFRARILGAVARQASEKASERLKRQRDQAAKRGVAHGGRRPYGYKRGGHDLDPAEAEHVLEAASRFLAGDSLPTIATDWNARGIRSSSGKEWSTTSLRTMLAGPRIAGLRVHRGQVVGDAAWPPIIDRDTHERLRAMLGDPRRNQRGRPPEHLLTGMLRCGRDGCGARMSSSTRTNGAKRYVCHAGPGHDGCGRVAVTALRIEDEVAKQVLAVLAESDLDEHAGPPGGAHLAERLRADEQKLDDLAHDYAEDRISRSEWLTIRDTVQLRVDTARAQLRQDTATMVLADLPRGLEALTAAWEAHDVPWRRKVLAAVVECVIVLPAAGPGPFDPDRVKPRWRA